MSGMLMIGTTIHRNSINSYQIGVSSCNDNDCKQKHYVLNEEEQKSLSASEIQLLAGSRIHHNCFYVEGSVKENLAALMDRVVFKGQFYGHVGHSYDVAKHAVNPPRYIFSHHTITIDLDEYKKILKHELMPLLDTAISVKALVGIILEYVADCAEDDINCTIELLNKYCTSTLSPAELHFIKYLLPEEEIEKTSQKEEGCDVSQEEIEKTSQKEEGCDVSEESKKTSQKDGHCIVS